MVPEVAMLGWIVTAGSDAFRPFSLRRLALNFNVKAIRKKAILQNTPTDKAQHVWLGKLNSYLPR